ncbi:GNAT family N-acetyltransferase [Paenibacillus sp. DMB20]|uniref:GNAT family N-acetyltransferase n=1 Tax=Paenibacillus sp. DMB20 TaxID=1642570 RepID=UPI0006281E0A|nr:GNAT family N-acetyltransferase [Paenibacillus sp. DMB20]KKO55411.1 acetyltransferase [Paenibacillus sp. DMB20]
MTRNIYYRLEPPESFEQLRLIYEALGWNSLNLSVEDLEKMCNQSWYAVYAFDHEKLIGMGRVISDGVITGIVCGLCVLPDYHSEGIGKELLSRIIDHCEQHRIIPQLMCVESLESYYEKHGFKKFTIGMTRTIR